jgi:hypothetical protein
MLNRNAKIHKAIGLCMGNVGKSNGYRLTFIFGLAGIDSQHNMNRIRKLSFGSRGPAFLYPASNPDAAECALPNRLAGVTLFAADESPILAFKAVRLSNG